jgi:hypothetical protein
MEVLNSELGQIALLFISDPIGANRRQSLSRVTIDAGGLITEVLNNTGEASAINYNTHGLRNIGNNVFIYMTPGSSPSAISTIVANSDNSWTTVDSASGLVPAEASISFAPVTTAIHAVVHGPVTTDGPLSISTFDLEGPVTASAIAVKKAA